MIEGKFVSTIDVVAPPPRQITAQQESAVSQVSYVLNDGDQSPIAYESSRLRLTWPGQFERGSSLQTWRITNIFMSLGTHLKREAEFLESAAKEARDVEIEFADDNAESWSESAQSFQIRHLSNSIDEASRTFDFFVPLENQSHSYQKDGETFLVWRFRPGQRARIHVPVDKIRERFPCCLLNLLRGRDRRHSSTVRTVTSLIRSPSIFSYEDRRDVVIANDGNITPGTYIAQSAGASLRRVLKSQSASGLQPGFHVHADGTVHAAH